jgi:uncharacterized protein (DUF58 family)
MKTIYIFAWSLAAAGVLASFLTGNFNKATLVIFSFIALGLVYSLALWSVLKNGGRAVSIFEDLNNEELSKEERS